MWIEIGHFSTLLALMFALVQVAAPMGGLLAQRPDWIRVGRQSAVMVALLLTIACAGLVISFLSDDFSVAFVARHASLALPVFYKATALWGGHEGSLLFWAWILALFTMVAVLRYWSSHTRFMPYVIAILGALIIGFLLLILFLSSPFERMIPPPVDGQDLNPLLQDPGMVFHPPFLYMGYVGFAIPYAFAMAALITGQAGESWILATRRWTLFSWAMLSTGIIFGAYWAYYELGWGGYWAWDPVENASFMPWLTGTAFLHSVMVQERRHTFKIWNLFLIVTTFALSLLGTFLVRSGVLSSVHAFATDPGRGVYILIFMAAILLFSFGLLVTRSDLLKTRVRLETLLCRESTFLFNNLFFITATLTVLLGTLYPLAVETLSDAKVSVGAPYYNKVFIPIMLGMFLLMGVGPMIAWRRSAPHALKRHFLVPSMLGVAGALSALVIGITHPYGVATVALILFVGASHCLEVWRGVRVRMARETIQPLTALMRMVRRNKRRYGGFIVHMGILMMAAGFVGSGLFQEERSLVMKPGESIRLSGWTFHFRSVDTSVSLRNWNATEATFHVVRHKGDKPIILKPQKRIYGNKRSQPTTEAAIHSTWLEDLYVVLGDRSDESGWSIKIYHNPLVGWIWWGSGLMALGVILALFQRQRRLPVR